MIEWGCRRPASGSRRSGRCRIPDDYRQVLRTACPPPERRGVEPARSSASASTSRRRRRCRSCATARRCASCRSTAAGRTPTRSCGSTTPPRRRPSGSPRWPPSAASRGSRATGDDLVRVAVRQGAAAARRGPGDLRGEDRWIEAADWIVWQLCGEETRNVCTAGYKGIHQDGDYPSGTTWPRSTRLRRLRGRQARASAVAAGRTGRELTAEAAAWTGLPEGIAVAVGNVDAHVTAPAAQAIEPGPDGRDHGHVDLPRDEPRRARRGAGDVRRRATAASRPACGAMRPVRAAWGHLRLVRGPPRRARYHEEAAARGLSLTTTCPSWRRSSRSASMGWSRSTGTAATARCSSTTSSAA